jgi:hypothetical protein
MTKKGDAYVCVYVEIEYGDDGCPTPESETRVAHLQLVVGAAVANDPLLDVDLDVIYGEPEDEQ